VNIQLSAGLHYLSLFYQDEYSKKYWEKNKAHMIKKD